MAPLQDKLDEITQNTRHLVQPERLAVSEQAIADLFASGVENNVLSVGSLMPAFALPEATHGKLVRSPDLIALGPLIIKFFRGRWDPYCVTELEAWRDLYPRVRQHGAIFVAISPQTIRQSAFMVQQHYLPYPVLRDENCALAAQFGVAYDLSPAMERYYHSILVNLPFINSGRNVMATNGQFASKLPLPATFVVGQNGTILFAEAHADFRVRPEPEDVLAALCERGCDSDAELG